MPRQAQQGFTNALDDLGASHASLDRLVALRPDVAKLDIGLVRGIDRDRDREIEAQAGASGGAPVRGAAGAVLSTRWFVPAAVS